MDESPSSRIHRCNTPRPRPPRSSSKHITTYALYFHQKHSQLMNRTYHGTDSDTPTHSVHVHIPRESYIKPFHANYNTTLKPYLIPKSLKAKPDKRKAIQVLYTYMQPSKSNTFRLPTTRSKSHATTEQGTHPEIALQVPSLYIKSH